MKKFITWDIFHLSLILSLLHLYPDRNPRWDSEPLGHEVLLGESSAYTQSDFHNIHNRFHGYYHPKSIDSDLERTLFIHDLNSLSNRRSWVNNPLRNEIFAYIVNGEEPINQNETNSEETNQNEEQSNELTQEDMDLIEILWKQDIDLGISRDVFDGTWNNEQQRLKEENERINLQKKTNVTQSYDQQDYQIDSETGERINVSVSSTSSSSREVPSNDFPNLAIEENFHLFDADNYEDTKKESADIENDESWLEKLKDLQVLAEESHVEFDEWDLPALPYPLDVPASSDNLEADQHQFLEGLLRNSSLPLSMEEPLPTMDFSDSIRNTEFEMDQLLSLLTNDTGDPDPIAALVNEFNHDLPDILPTNLTTDVDFFNNILYNEDFDELMDLPALVPLATDLDNDSAVSSMGSEASYDWMSTFQNNSGSSTHSGDNINENNPSSTRENLSFQANQAVAQKKYHFFGKNLTADNSSDSEKSDSGCSQSSTFYEYQGALSSSATLLVPPKTFQLDTDNFYESYENHNHTYHRPEVADLKPFERHKEERDKRDEEEDGKDVKRAKELNLPISVKDITFLPIEEFNELLTRQELTEEQLALIRDIRRRGKNKVAAQNCRKRKMDQILNLQLKLEDLQEERNNLVLQQEKMSNNREILQSKYNRLYRFIFQGLDQPGPSSETLMTQEQNKTLERENKGARLKRKVNKK